MKNFIRGDGSKMLKRQSIEFVFDGVVLGIKV